MKLDFEKKTLRTKIGAALGRLAILAEFGVVLAGCQSPRDAYNGRQFDDQPTMTIKGYVDEIRSAAVKKVDPDDCDPIRGVELSASATSYNFVREYELVYVDADYVSFKTYVVNYFGGAGNHSQVFVGTIDRKTGRVLGVVDFVPKRKWTVLKQKLYNGAVKKIGGKENLQDEAEIIENFYYSKDGLHFVYNPYEIVCGATGVVEVVIDPKTL